MKLVVVSALFTAALAISALWAAQPSAAPASPDEPQISMQPDDDEANQVGSECVVAGGVCRKSACRPGEISVPLSCGHDLGCCLTQ
jgi:hypothetical protein